MSQHTGMGSISCTLTCIVKIMVALAGLVVSITPSSLVAPVASNKLASWASPPCSTQPIPSQPGPFTLVRTYAKSSTRCPPPTTSPSSRTRSQTAHLLASSANSSMTLKIPSNDQRQSLSLLRIFTGLSMFYSLFCMTLYTLYLCCSCILMYWFSITFYAIHSFCSVIYNLYYFMISLSCFVLQYCVIIL